ncbi:MAG: ABC transporter ATP-binding protein [Candidatus Metalachnospira sp.]|nr:ABC transporter ATP-binding protein [Candidatus Metalachnospira sp.]
MSLKVKNLHIEASMRGNAKSTIVSNVSFEAEEGKRLALVGRSGCGKTMTAMAVLGLLPENCTADGNIEWNGVELLSLSKKERRALLGKEHVLIPQSGSDFLNPSLTVKRQMSEALSRVEIPKREQQKYMERILERVGFDHIECVLNSYPFQLSGGMAQRIVMAMASTGKPRLVIADEPTRGIDRNNTEQFLSILNDLFSNSAVVLITHDMSIASKCDYILVMNDGRVIELGSSSEVLTNPKEAYTRQLICDLPSSLSYAQRGII